VGCDGSEDADSAATDDGTSARGRIAFVSERDGNSEIYVINADGSGLTNLTNNPANEPAEGETDGTFDWSPDGTSIVFTSDRDDGNPEIYVMDADGSDQARLTNTPDFAESYPRWSPDGGQIAFVKSGPYGPDTTTRIFVMNDDGSNVRRLTRGDATERDPAWSPDGQRIAYLSGGINIIDADGSNERAVVDADHSYYSPTWSPDGSRIAYSSYRDSMKEDDPGMYQQIFVVDPDGSDLIHIPEGANGDDYYAGPSWAPDSRQIVFSSDEDPGLNLHVMDADGTNRARITDDGALIGVWSPHGSRIAALTIKPGEGSELDIALALMNPDGSDRIELTDIVSQAYFAWSPVP
jgi:TolB protein